MRSYIIKRIAQGILLVFTVSVIVFSMLHMMPGDPVELLTDRKVSEEYKAELKEQYGLDLPIHYQYARWLKNVMKGDFGTSIRSKLKVSDMLKRRIPVTIRLTGLALLVQLAIALPLGLIAARYKDGLVDRVIIMISLFFAALPSFWISMLMIMFFGLTLRVLPISGFESGKHLIMPVTAMVLSGIAPMIRMTKTEVLDVLRERYVLTAYAKGLSKETVMVKHVLRNALILVTIMLFMQIPWIISGAVIIESIFVIPGMGGLLTSSILSQDFTVVQACVLMISVLTVICNLICDIITAFLDPRIRLSMSGGDQ